MYLQLDRASQWYLAHLCHYFILIFHHQASSESNEA